MFKKRKERWLELKEFQAIIKKQLAIAKLQKDIKEVIGNGV